MATDKIFVDGMRFELPNEGQKEKTPWIKGKISIKAPDLISFLEKHQNNGGWVNIDLKKSDNTGKYYLELNTWKPKPVEQAPATKEEMTDPITGNITSDMPF